MTGARVSGPRARRDITGILLLDKPAGISSNAALQRARARFGAVKAGHTGNLDVAASGLLPICFGEATKVCGWLLDADKVYDATVALGVTTTTGDAEGEVLARQPVTPDMLARLPALLASFVGTRAQVPPMYSALKRNGKPLYQLARAGIEVERAPREVTLHSLALMNQEAEQFVLRVHCSKGTYIRVLAEDIGAALGCGASLTALRRVASGPFALADALTLEQLWALQEPLEAFDDRLLPADLALAGLPMLAVGMAEARALGEGRVVQASTWEGSGPARAYAADGRFVGLVEVLGDRRILPRRIFGRTSGLGHQSQ